METSNITLRRLKTFLKSLENKFALKNHTHLSDSELSTTSMNPVQNKVITQALQQKADKSETTVNLLKPTLQTTTQNGVTCTNNGDGTYTLNGTNSSDTQFSFLIGNVTIINKDRYKLVGCPSNKSMSTVHMYLNNADFSISLNDTGNGQDTILPSGVYNIQIEVRGNETVNDIFKPMLTTNLSATYDDFVPYTGDTGSLNGDVAQLQDSKADKTEVPKLVKVDNKTVFISEDGVLSAKGGGTTIIPKPTVNPAIKSDNAKVTITWQDPTDVIYDGAVFSKWAGTKLVMKESGYPTSPDDGTLLVDCTERDKYKKNGYVKEGLINDKVYYFALFPYSTDGVYNYDAGNRLLGEPCALKIVTFADGTDEEIAAMIQAHYDNKINIADYWAVGDKRSVNLSAMSATYVGESHRAQTVQFAIADFEKDELSAAINGHTMAAITLTQVNCLMDATSASNSTNGSNDTERGYMNSSNTNAGGWTDCARRKWCNEVYYNALPSTLRNTVKAVNKKTSAGSQSSTINTTTDKVFLLAEIEIFGTTSYSVSGEGTQYQYYKNATANRYKMPKWTSSYVSHIYWERSPYSGNTNNFCNVYNNGIPNANSANGSYGVAPCLCI